MISSGSKDRKRELFDHSFDWLKKALPVPPRKDWTVLEAGQGRDGFSNFYRRMFDTVYGVDIEDYSASYPGVISLRADICRGIPLRDRTVDLVVSHSVLEHVMDIRGALRNLDRVVKVGRFIFITISPLYYSAKGSHVNSPDQLANWEHLDPASDYYLLGNPLGESRTGGHNLNKMNLSDFLGAVGELPWSIESCKVKIDNSDIPPHVDRDRWSESNLRTRGFFFLARKEWHCE